MECEICGGREERDDRLIAPCDCSKKLEDVGLMHVSCLKEMLSRRALELERGKPACPRCRVEYRVSVLYNWTWDNVLSMKAFGHCMEIVMLAIIIGMTAVSLYLVDFAHEDPGAVRVLMGMFALTGVMAVYTMLTLFRRWRNAAGEMEVEESAV